MIMDATFGGYMYLEDIIDKGGGLTVASGIFRLHVVNHVTAST
jgi:hypothetical protein